MFSPYGIKRFPENNMYVDLFCLPSCDDIKYHHTHFILYIGIDFNLLGCFCDNRVFAILDASMLSGSVPHNFFSFDLDQARLYSLSH